MVNDPNEPQGLGDELVLMLSDIGLNERGELLPADSGGNFGDLFGREGTVLLVNGKVRPTLKVRSGKQQRWRVINAARARYYNLRLRDHRFVTLGGDNGFAARSADVYNVIVTPGERADVVFTPADEPGTRNVLRWVPTERGYGTVFARPREDMLLIETVSAPRVAPEPIPEVLRSIEPIDVAGAVHQRIELTIAIGHSDVVMGINGVPHARVKPIDAAIGETHVWTIVNDTDFAHPFHLHGYFFQVLDDMRVPEWKDTVSVPAKSQLQIAFELDERPGMWMYHCHILDHAEAGMMGHLHVRDLEAPAGACDRRRRRRSSYTLVASSSRPYPCAVPRQRSGALVANFGFAPPNRVGSLPLLDPPFAQYRCERTHAARALLSGLSLVRDGRPLRRAVARARRAVTR